MRKPLTTRCEFVFTPTNMTNREKQIVQWCALVARTHCVKSKLGLDCIRAGAAIATEIESVLK